MFGMAKNRGATWLIAAAASLAILSGTARATPLEVRVVIVTTWEQIADGRDVRGELHDWLTKWPLSTALPFPVGAHPLQYDPASHVLAILTGMATAKAAASIMALGMDPRFDLSHAYWIVAGTAGVDPKVASVGSAAWARWVIDGDLDQELDARDMPADWPTGVVPYDRTRPYEMPAPALHSASANVGYALNMKLVDWAFAKTRDATLPDDAVLARLREPYSGPAHRSPFVLEGEGLMSARVWYGGRFNTWAEDWIAYWTGGRGVFAMSAEEDTGVLQALSFLAQDGRARLDRVLVLRGASDYTVGPPGTTAAEFLSKEAREGFPAEQQALDNLYAVASPVARALTEGWAQTRETTPGS